MERRKFLLGAGSLAAAGAAAMGTGAFSSISANRDANFEIVNDSNAFLKLTAPNSLENGEYASSAGEGEDQLVLNFNGDASVTGTGLNADSEQWFDAVFRITNHGANSVQTFVDDDNLDDDVGGTVLSERVVFYEGDTSSNLESGGLDGASPIEGYQNNGEGSFAKDDDESNTQYSTGSAGTGYYRVLDPGESVDVGVYIDTRGVTDLGEMNSSGDQIQVKGKEP